MLSCSAGNGGESASGGAKVSQLWSLVLLLSVFFWGRRGPVSFRAVKGEGGRVSFGVGCETVAVCFCFGGRRGDDVSQLWSCVVLFCGEWRRVSFRGGEGGMM